MKRNLLLFSAVLISIFLVVNSTKKILMFRNTSQKVGDFETRLKQLRQENSELKQELEYKKSNEFVEGEIRNKLGLVKEGEVVFVIPKKDEGQTTNDERQEDQAPNWQKWWNLFFGG